MSHPKIADMTPSHDLDTLNTSLAELSHFSPDDRAVLLYIQRDSIQPDAAQRAPAQRATTQPAPAAASELLLIEKKRGLGAGKVNGPGGKLEQGESFVQATIRECGEEIGLTPHNVEIRGRLYFSFTDGYTLYAEVFWAYHFSGELIETDEAKPFWCPVQNLPYDRMWFDDRIWLPHALAGNKFSGYFLFDDDRLIHSQVQYHFSPASFSPAPPKNPQKNSAQSNAP